MTLERLGNRGVFVTGTDTDVGKTVVSAWLLRHLGWEYWKPVQAGVAGGTDVARVRHLSGAAAHRFHPSAYVLREPLSPHEAARREGIEIELERFRLPVARPLVVEGAGGVLVPLNPQALMVDLMVRLGLPVVLVSRTALGTLNHTLLSLEALRHRGVEVVGVVMCGAAAPHNRQAIEQYGQVAVVGEIPWLEPLTPETLAGVQG